jgi:lipopolysaccharide heptosyltransferase II
MHFQKNIAKRILIINIFGIGDVLFTTPLIKNLKTACPGSYIGYVCNRRTSPVLEHNPHVDKLIICDRDEYNEACRTSRMLAFRKMVCFLKEVRRERFDVAIDVSLSNFTSCAAFLAGIKHRIGFQYKKRSFLLNKKFVLKGYEDRHVVEYYQGLLEELGVPAVEKNLELYISQKDNDWADGFLASNIGPRNGHPVVGLVPGGGASWGQNAVYKRWPPEKYAKLADKLIEKFSAAIILFGNKDESPLCEKVSSAMHHQPVLACGKTTISQFAALARKCSLMVLNDGGPLHVAVAAGAHTASIFGPVDERVYGPYPQGKHIVITKGLPCQPCYRRFRKSSGEHISCVSQLTVEDVLEKIKGVL